MFAFGEAVDQKIAEKLDAALAWRAPVLRMLRTVVGVGQVVFGADYPYPRRDLAVACRGEVETSAEPGGEDSRAVLAGNALKLFPRLAARATTEMWLATAPESRFPQ